MKSAIVEREAGDTAAQRRLLEEGLRRFPAYWKLWMMLGQVRGKGGGLGGKGGFPAYWKLWVVCGGAGAGVGWLRYYLVGLGLVAGGGGGKGLCIWWGVGRCVPGGVWQEDGGPLTKEMGAYSWHARGSMLAAVLSINTCLFYTVPHSCAQCAVLRYNQLVWFETMPHCVWLMLICSCAMLCRAVLCPAAGGV
jgi:hypothetical protein